MLGEYPTQQLVSPEPSSRGARDGESRLQVCVTAAQACAPEPKVTHMVDNPFSRRTALRGLLTSVAAVTAQKALGNERDRFQRTKTVTSRARAGTAATGTTGAVTGSTSEVPTTLGWLSGFGDDKASTVADGTLGRWRGEEVTYARIWADASLRQMANVWMMDTFKTYGWTGTLDIACGGPREGQTWATAATGGMDATWQSTCRKIYEKWGNLTSVHLSMAHELNGNWYPWSVNSTNVTQFKTAWARWYTIVQTELVAKGKNAKVCLCLNSDTASGVSLLSLIPPLEYVDILGCDFYSMYPDLTTQVLWDRNLLTKKSDGAPRGIQAWFNYATSIGKPLAFPEWAVNSLAASDNPFFIEQMRNIFAANASLTPTAPGPGKVAGEAYFNAKDKTRLTPTTMIPDSATRYQQLYFGGVSA